MEDEKQKISEQVFFINKELLRYNGTLCVS